MIKKEKDEAKEFGSLNYCIIVVITRNSLIFKAFLATAVVAKARPAAAATVVRRIGHFGQIWTF